MCKDHKIGTQNLLTDEELTSYTCSKKGEHKRVLVFHVRTKVKVIKRIEGDQIVTETIGGAPIATMVAFKHGDTLLFGYSKLNRALETISYDKREAVRLAIGRFAKAHDKGRAGFSLGCLLTSDRGLHVPDVVKKIAPDYIARGANYFKQPFDNITYPAQPGLLKIPVEDVDQAEGDLGRRG